VRTKRFLLPALALLAAALCAAPPARAESFLDSDDYKDGDEVVNVFLHDDEYAIMVEEFTRNGQEFDWGWVLTPGWSPSPPAQSGGGLRGRLGRRSGPKLDSSPKQLGFSLADYKSAFVPAVGNFAGIVRPEELAQVHDALVSAVTEMGLKSAASEAEADLVLESALVDVGREGGGFGLIQVKPFIEVELRLREKTGGRTLFLARTQKHANDAFDASLTMASQVALVLR
jgi:hypothetical protein